MIPAEIEPTLLGQIAPGDGEEGGDSGLGREQVIACRMAYLGGHIVANRKHPAIGIDEEAEFSLFSNSLSAVCNGAKRISKGVQILRRLGERRAELPTQCTQPRIVDEC